MAVNRIIMSFEIRLLSTVNIKIELHRNFKSLDFNINRINRIKIINTSFLQLLDYNHGFQIANLDVYGRFLVSKTTFNRIEL